MKKLAWIVVAGLLAGCADDWSAGLGREHAAVSAATAGVSPLVVSPMVPGAAAPAALPARSPRAFAGAPDRGSLVSYPAAPVVRRSGAYTFHAAELSEEHAWRATVTGRLNFIAPDGTPIALDYVRHVEHPDGNWSWIGRTPGEQGESTVLTFGEAAVFGTIPQPGDKPPLRLTVSDGRSWVVSADPRLLRGIRNEATHPTRPDYLVPPKTAAALGATAGMQAMAAPSLAAASVSGRTMVDVAVGYTGGFATARGGSSAAVTRIRNLVDVTNQAYLNSQVNAEVRLVHAMQVSYPDATDNGVALEELTGFKAPSTKTTPAPAFSALRAARDTYGADLVVLVRRFQDPENEGCGIAWLIGGGRSGIETSDSYFGYSVVSDGQDQGTDGNTYFCREETFAHELGHSMGSQHDSGNAKDDDGAVSYGAYDYSFGYKNLAGGFYTVMAYGDSGQRSYRVFSNPNVTYCGGSACGIANQADNARSLNQTAGIIANFRATKVPQRSNAVASDFNGDGYSDVLWRNVGSGANSIWNSANRSTGRVLTTVLGTSWRMDGTGDFDGDGEVDIFWRNHNDGRNVIWRSGNSANAMAVATVVSRSWRLAGVGDFDGDGRSDLLWRNHGDGRNVIWLAANDLMFLPVDTVPVGSWIIAGIGDFNADGRSDIFWRNLQSGRNAIWRSGNASTTQAVDRVANLSWKVATIGDLNGDGRSDVVWRNSSNGANSVWLSANVSTLQLAGRVADQAWKIVACGDYDGDGNADLLWRNHRTGVNSVWRSGNVSTLMALKGASLSWAVKP